MECVYHKGARSLSLSLSLLDDLFEKRDLSIKVGVSLSGRRTLHFLSAALKRIRPVLFLQKIKRRKAMNKREEYKIINVIITTVAS